MNEFDYSVLAARIAKIQQNKVSLEKWIALSYEALGVLQEELQSRTFSLPSEFLQVFSDYDFKRLSEESEKVADYYRITYLIGFLYSILCYADRPLELDNLDEVRLTFSALNVLNRDERIVYILQNRWKDFERTSHWVPSAYYKSIADDLAIERDSILAEVKKHLRGE